MEKKTLGILALALVGLFAISMVVAMPFGNAENRDAVRAAVEAGDYDAWKSLMSAQITEENFNKMTERHRLMIELREAREAGDDEAVDALMEEMKELMPEGPMGLGKGFGKGFNKGMGRGNHEGCPFAE